VYEREHNISGRVVLSFVVEKDGLLSKLTAIRTPSEGLAEEALRVLKLSPKWTPSYSYGIPQRVNFTVPISFTIGVE
jgi:protein TonB